MRRYQVYILRCSDGSLYTGCTSDMARRLAEHQSGKASRYTRSRLPVTVSYTEPALGRADALRREAQIKKMSRSAKLLLCAGSRPKPSYSSR